MNKQEFLDELTIKYERVGNLRPATEATDFDIRKDQMGYSFYAISVDDLTTHDGVEVSKTGTVFFKVYDEDTPDERVVREEKLEPKFIVGDEDTSFIDAVKDWYTDNKAAEIVKFEVTEANKELQFAILRVFEVVGDKATEKRILIYKEGSTISAVVLEG